MKKPGSKFNAPKKYTIQYASSVVKEDIPKLDSTTKKIIKTNIETKLTFDPIHYGKPLQYSFRGFRSLRVGNYRVIYQIDPIKCMVSIVSISHRQTVNDC